jgi:hypothetical protein
MNLKRTLLILIAVLFTTGAVQFDDRRWREEASRSLVCSAADAAAAARSACSA